MECVEAKALKTSFRPEVPAKSTTQQAVLDDVWCGNGPSGVVSGDDFFVDDLLNFSNGDVEEEGVVVEEEEDEEEEEEKDCVSVCSHEQGENDTFKSNGFLPLRKDDLGSVPTSELCVPTDDLADLEWLSHFVEDSFSEFSLSCPAGNLTTKTLNQSENNRSESETGTASLKPSPCFMTSVPSRARSKRSRTGGRVWSIGSPSLTESSSTSSSTSSSSYSSSSTSCLIFSNTSQNMELVYFLGKPPLSKKQKKSRRGPESGLAQPQRRCSHCHVQKTPQWRTGPMGPKTLCNACGVRFKSGRLLPEYRPACSPTFSSDVHSNNHRKVLEMRRKKETVCPESGLPTAVQSF